jgi:endoglucanase
MRRFAFTTAWVVLTGAGALFAADNGTELAPGENARPSPAPSASVDAAGVTATVPAGSPLLSNPTFANATKGNDWPDDWDRSEGVTWLAEGNSHFLRFTSTHPDEQVQVERAMAIPDGVKGLELRVRYRTAGVKTGWEAAYDARMILEFLDKIGKPVEPGPQVAFAGDAKGWTDVTEKFAVPVDARGLLITPCLYRVDAGTLDVAEVRVVSLGDEEAGALAASEAAALAKKEAEKAATIEREIALPPITKELRVSGNRLVTADGKAVWLQGVNVSNLETNPEANHNPVWSIHVAIEDWKANVVRLPVYDGFWFGNGKGALKSNDREAYRAVVDRAIKLAAGQGAYIVLDLHKYRAPEDAAVAFWKDAAARYKNNPAVLFDVLNEPHDISWEVWRNGGMVATPAKGNTPATAFHSPGMQGLVEAVRGTGARNVIVAGGLGYAFDLSGVLNGYALDDKGGNGIMYATHFYNWAKGWESHFLPVAAKYPVLVGECGADPHKMTFVPAELQENPYTWAPDAIGLIQKYKLNWTAWCFHTRATPNMLLDWDYTPTPFWGAFVKDALSGRRYEMQRMR